jgi:hypothetical protein
MGPLSAADSKPLQEKEQHPLHPLKLGRGYEVALQPGPIAAALTPGSCSFKSQFRTVGYCSPCGDAPRPLGELPVEAVRPDHQLARDIPEAPHKEHRLTNGLMNGLIFGLQTRPRSIPPQSPLPQRPL